MSRFVRGRNGAAAVEFALVTPPLLMMVIGTLAFGLYFGAVHGVQQLAAEAARASVPGVTETERASLAARFVQTALPSYSLLRASSMTVTAAFDPNDSNLFVVTLSYDASHLGLNVFDRILPVPISQFARRATVRRGGP